MTVPAPRKHILAIVDPDTNEEVKVGNVDTKPPSRSAPAPAPATTVKIPTRTSRPLELVADPADTLSRTETASTALQATESVKTGGASEADKLIGEVSENKEKPVDVPLTVGGKPVVTESVPEVKRANAPQALSSRSAERFATDAAPSSLVQSDPKQLEPPLSSTSLNTGPQVDVVKETEVSRTMRTSVSAPAASELTPVSNAPTDPAKAFESVTAGDSAVSFEAVVDTTAPKEKIEEAKVSPANGVSVTGSLNARTSPTPAADMALTAQQPETPEAPAMGKKEVSSSTVTSVDTETNSQAATPRRERLVFKEGDRRVYAPDFMLSMRYSADPKRAAEYEATLSSNNIFKNGPSSASGRGGEPRGSRSMRGTTGPLSADPRGMRAFPPQPGPGYMGPSRAGPPGMVGGGVGSYDAFDLRSARSQNPPPVPKGQSNHGRSGQDPRGSRGRFDGPTRGGPGPIDPFVFVAPPVEKLKRSEHGWKRDKESDNEITAKVKQIRSLLNKLTLEKFDKIFKQIIDINISSYEILAGVVKEVFEKALFEPKFSGMYAELCVRLDLATKDMLQKANIMDSKGKPIYFKNILLNNCRDEFTRFAVASETSENKPMEAGDEAKDEKGKTDDEDGAKDDENKEEKPLTPDEKKANDRKEKEDAAKQATKAKRRMLANVRFIGELFLKDLLREQIIHIHCIQRLLTIGIENREEDVLEALCRLLSKTGAKLSQNKEAVTHIDNYFKPLQLMSRDHTLPARVRFMLQDLIEQRVNGWKVRREEAGAKTIAEIHKDIEKEERAKAEAQAAARDRRGRGGGGMHHRDRGPQNFPPRVAMTMASRQKAGSGVSRSTAMLEKHANRGSSNAPSSLQSVRLGPGGLKSSGVSAGPGGTSLRPGGSRYGAFSALSESRESSSNAPSGDARRATAKKWPGVSRRSATVKPEPVEAKPKLMDLEKLKRKTRGIVGEYWSIVMLSEAKECIEQEILAPNYPKFVEEAIKFSLASNVENRSKSIPLFVGLIGETIPGADFVTGFSAVIAELTDIEMDDPRASEVLARYIGAAAATGKLKSEESEVFGLDNLKGALLEISDPKRATKLVVHIFAELYKNLIESIPDEGQRKEAVKRSLNALDLDLSSRMSAWNQIRGVATLETMLKDTGILFAMPLLPVELRLKEALDGGATKEDVSKIFNSIPDEELRTEAFMKMVIRVSFDCLFMKPPTSVKDAFGNVVGSPLVECFRREISRDVQMAALLESQSFIVKNLDILPPHKEGDYDKPGSIAFDSLYFADIVEEDTFLGWKEDTDKSTKVDGKERMIIQTHPFFQWLATAEEE